MAETTKLNLGIKDRIILPTFFPERSNYVDKVLRDDVSLKIRISQEEMVAVNLHNDEKDGKQFMTWSREKEVPKEVEFTEAEIGFLKACVEAYIKDNNNLSDDEYIVAKAIKGL